MEKPQIVLGIDTFSFYFPLSYHQKEQVITRLKSYKGFYQENDDYWAESCEYRSEAFADQGIKIRVFQKKRSVWGLMVTIHPMLLLGNPDRSALYNPKRKTYRELDALPIWDFGASWHSLLPGRYEALPCRCDHEHDLSRSRSGECLFADSQKGAAASALSIGILQQGFHEGKGCQRGEPEQLQAELPIRCFFCL